MKNQNEQITPRIRTRNKRRAIVSAVSRLVFWFVLLFVVPFVLLPQQKELYEEFGISLPANTQYTLAIGDRIMKYSLIYCLVVAQLIVAWQGALILLRPRRFGRILVAIDWLLILGISLFLIAAFVMPMLTIVYGLTGKS